MEIRLVSSLTSEDESRVAAALCAALRAILDQFGIAYTIRIETSDGHTVNQTSALNGAATPAARATGQPPGLVSS